MSGHWLESAYWISQVVLAIIASVAAIAAFVQIRTFKLFEMLKFLESPDVRNARRVVFREIDRRKDEDWWDDPVHGERLESAASDVCAAYDILGRMIEYDGLERAFSAGGYGSFFRQFWGRSIVQTHEALRRFIDHRRGTYPDAYAAYSRLANSARKYVGPSVGSRLSSN